MSEDALSSENSIIITLDDSSIIYSDLKIPETFAAVIKKGLPVEASFSGYKNKIYSGEVDGVSSRINAETRSLLTRIKINNDDLETLIAYVLCFRLLNIAIEYLLFIQNQFHNFFQFFH